MNKKKKSKDFSDYLSQNPKVSSDYFTTTTFDCK